MAVLVQGDVFLFKIALRVIIRVAQTQLWGLFYQLDMSREFFDPIHPIGYSRQSGSDCMPHGFLWPSRNAIVCQTISRGMVMGLSPVHSGFNRDCRESLMSGHSIYRERT